MSDNLRIKGQEISVRVVAAGALVASIDSVATMNDNDVLNLVNQGFLGETANRWDETFDGTTADFEIQLTKADAHDLDDQIKSKAKRETPDLVFNIVRTELYADGSSMIWTYPDVHWGGIGTTIASRGDYLKKKYNIGCSGKVPQKNGVV